MDETREQSGDNQAESLQLLMRRAGQSRPVCEGGMSLASAADAPYEPGPDAPTHLWSDTRDLDDLSVQRWGIVAPEGPEGDRLLALVEPLKRAREEAQGATAMVYRIGADMDGIQASAWKKDVLHGQDIEDVPRYLLLLGDLDRVPLEFQQVLATDAFVGRLAFDDDAGYAAYAEKAIRASQVLEASAARALFFTADDRSQATRLAKTGLVQPLLAYATNKLAGKVAKGQALDVGEEESANPERLLEEAEHDDPALLLTVSHGLGAPHEGWSSLADRRARQGAMCLEQDEYLTGADLKDKRFLPFGAWILYACFGGGTPGRSLFHHWLARLGAAGGYRGSIDGVLSALPQSNEPPFIAALPKAVLSSSQGPLAVISHVDLAWTYAFRDDGAGTKSRSSRFQGMLRGLAEGARAGVAISSLLRQLGEANSELATRADTSERSAAAGATAEDEAQGLARARLWMLRQDLSGYLLLGDPAARLPVSAKGAAAAKPKASTMGVGASPAAVVTPVAAPTVATAPLSEAEERQGTQREKAVIELLSGIDTEARVAARAGVDAAQLRGWVEAYRAAGRAALARL